jgi:hypothetical protein
MKNKKLAHPYRSLPDDIQNLGAALAPNMNSDDAAASMRRIRQDIDGGAANNMSRSELAENIRILSECRDKLRKRHQPGETNLPWISIVMAGITAVIQFTNFPLRFVFLCIATAGLAVNRLMAARSKPWLNIATEGDGAVADLRAIATLLPPSGLGTANLLQNVRGLPEKLLPPFDSEPAKNEQAALFDARPVPTQLDEGPTMPPPARSGARGTKKKKRR